MRGLRLRTVIRLAVVGAILSFGSADAATIVALGASNTFGKGVARNQAYPAQLEAILRARGSNVQVVNAGINGDTTQGMLNRVDHAVPNGTSAVILQPGGNDRRLVGGQTIEHLLVRPAVYRDHRLRGDHELRAVPQLACRLERRHPAILQQHDIDELTERMNRLFERATQLGQGHLALAIWRPRPLKTAT